MRWSGNQNVISKSAAAVVVLNCLMGRIVQHVHVVMIMDVVKNACTAGDHSHTDT